MRVAALQRIIKMGSSRLGKNETVWLDFVERAYSCKIIRQYHIKDLGYIVDGYCPETNTVYEVYEPWHERQSKQIKDKIRQEQIQQHLQCKFIKIHEKDLLWELKHSQMFFV